MDKTNSRWFRWIAGHAKYIFWGVWGGGVGAFGAVFFKTVDVGGDALRVYLGVLTVMMGGALGLISSRPMDLLVDSRKRRRKINMARLRLTKAAEALDKLAVARSNFQAKLNLSAQSRDDVFELIALGKLLGIATASQPDFDDVLDTEEDLKEAMVADDTLRFVSELVKITGSPTTEVEAMKTACQLAFGSDQVNDPFPGYGKTIRLVEAHFAQKVGSDRPAAAVVH